MLERRTVLDDRWRVRRLVGRGTFAEIYEAADLRSEKGPDGRRRTVAVKATVLRDLQGRCACAELIELGRGVDTDGGPVHFLAMQLLGENLAGVQMVDAIRTMHEMGWVHRDIKPSNFCVGLGAAMCRCHILDFGLARRWRNSDGVAHPARASAEFRGTCKYASIRSHQNQDLGRADDLWSLLYMLMELLLPRRCPVPGGGGAELRAPDGAASMPRALGKLFRHLQASERQSQEAQEQKLKRTEEQPLADPLAADPFAALDFASKSSKRAKPFDLIMAEAEATPVQLAARSGCGYGTGGESATPSPPLEGEANAPACSEALSSDDRAGAAIAGKLAA
ncbi:tau tubulin kinase 1 [Emiliania huxleyi CCMP1516]|uniref:Protein kinase domain-containing protein n=2 Tax=Emiliania huxleyi TaxID=2903 RepID=A0A0D3IQM8_EMIH1|nr:tau tubulin kinase 1 [Emiliania huxleyi CCMP1516]EOD13563.1 tau tubulin kinase 1 [Emiliania huxleyi CCMP1516]|eukprot:XP_005765992.1 tau tubulin kinase 1 [Emiliania huxleyi CCMP1516]